MNQITAPSGRSAKGKVADMIIADYDRHPTMEMGYLGYRKRVYLYSRTGPGFISNA